MKKLLINPISYTSMCVRLDKRISSRCDTRYIPIKKCLFANIFAIAGVVMRKIMIVSGRRPVIGADD